MIAATLLAAVQSQAADCQGLLAQLQASTAQVCEDAARVRADNAAIAAGEGTMATMCSDLDRGLRSIRAIKRVEARLAGSCTGVPYSEALNTMTESYRHTQAIRASRCGRR